MQFVLQTWGQLKTLSFPGPNGKRSVVGGHFYYFGSGQVGNLISGRGVFYQGIRYFFPRILGISKFTP